MKKSAKISLGVFVFLLVVVLSLYLLLNTGKQVDITWSEEDFDSGLTKSKIDIGSIEELNLETLARGNFSTQGRNSIDDSFTSEEMSALVSMANDSGGPIRDVKVSFGDNGQGEISFRLSDNFTQFLREQNVLAGLGTKIARADEGRVGEPLDRSLTDVVVDYIANVANKKPVYATGELSRASDNSVNIRMDSLTVGRAPLTRGVIDRVEFETARIVNSIISPENGFHIEELQVRDGALFYKGDLPAEIEGEGL